MSIHDLVPAHGVRVLLELERRGEQEVVYRVEVHAPDASHATRARISVGGDPIDALSVALEPWRAIERDGGATAAEAPERWALESARGFLRTLHKQHAKDGAWPRRVLRWRERGAK